MFKNLIPKRHQVPKETERRIIVNQYISNAEFHYANNHVRTSKYNVFTFLPKTLFEQFQRFANTFFLALLIMQIIPGNPITSLNPSSTALPLVTVLCITALKDALDDYHRHRNDHLVNGRRANVLRDGVLREGRWEEVIVGDIIRMEDDQFVAADLLLLASSEPHSLCYIETAELDGETNLKSRQALPETAVLGNDNDGFNNIEAEIVCEPPNNNLNRFEGKLMMNETSYPLNNNQVLLRGCILRNTAWCFGVVLFAGKDTKLMQNSGTSKRKQTNIDHLLNHLILRIMVFLFCMCSFCTVASGIWETYIGENFQVVQPWAVNVQKEDTDELLPPQWSPGNAIAITAILVFFSYIIILNTVVPISLYVSIEMLRFVQSFWINWDCEMVSKKIHAKARTTTLNEELGQIKYIFSDKTGTLTQNIMTFNKCSINGQRYGDAKDDKGQLIEPITSAPFTDFSDNPEADTKFRFYDKTLWERIKHKDVECGLFFRVLSLCHTVMPEEKNGRLIYQAQSPDEAALVGAARNFGYIFHYRTPTDIAISVLGDNQHYKLLDILDFNNVRKRMTVIVLSDGKITLYCKGADSVIMERLKVSPENEKVKALTNDHLQSFASEGLRTLCLAWKEMSQEQYDSWKAMYREATLVMENREEMVDAAAEQIEKDLILIGASAIEDKLQEGVPDAIASLAKAEIKIWVLTGDKLETAVNIGYSCKLLTDEMREIFIIDNDEAIGVKEQLVKARQSLRHSWNCDTPPVSPFSSKPKLVFDNQPPIDVAFVENGQITNAEPHLETDMCALVIQGTSLVHALSPALQLLFLEVACLCRSVVCCRVTPLQKALVVLLVKQNKKVTTLAIGDGANDVNMIKVAHIGVGISGQEGMQAVLASDFSIGQFRFLKRLLLVHGRWSYYRVAKFLQYFFYKNFLFTMCHLWYAFYCGFTAQTVYDSWFITFYNLFYTALAILALGVLEQDVNDKNSLKFPKLYIPGHGNLLYNGKIFVESVLYGVISSLVLFFITYGSAYSVDDLQSSDSFGTALATILLVTVSVQVALDTTYWTFFNFCTIIGSVFFYFALTLFLYCDLLQTAHTGSGEKVYGNPTFWFTLVLIVVVLTVPVLLKRFYAVITSPTLSDLVRLRQKHESKGRRMSAPIADHSLRISVMPTLRPRKRSYRSSYAFSHEEGFGNLITTGTNMRNRKESGCVRLLQQATQNSPLENRTILEDTIPEEPSAEALGNFGERIGHLETHSHPDVFSWT